jgi:hypothetical protein
MLSGATDTADSALRTVVLPLVLVIQEHAYGAPIGTHDNAAPLADLAGVLNKRTPHTSHSNNRVPIHHMASLHILFVFELNLVVAEPATKELITTGG